METIPCPAAGTPDCPVYEQEGECYTDIHHRYWPSSKYKSRVEKEFRQLEVNKVDICRWLHNTIHATEGPPVHPTVEAMRRVINEQNT